MQPHHRFPPSEGLRDNATVTSGRPRLGICCSLTDQRIIPAPDLLREVLAQMMTPHKMLAEALE